jgi:hypothetical protein
MDVPREKGDGAVDTFLASLEVLETSRSEDFQVII